MEKKRVAARKEEEAAKKEKAKASKIKAVAKRAKKNSDETDDFSLMMTPQMKKPPTTMQP